MRAAKIALNGNNSPLPKTWLGGVSLNLALAAALDVSADAVDILRL